MSLANLGVQIRTVSSNYGCTSGQALIAVDEDDTPRVDCLINEFASQREVYQEVGVVYVFYGDPHMGESRLRVFGRDLILTY